MRANGETEIKHQNHSFSGKADLFGPTATFAWRLCPFDNISENVAENNMENVYIGGARSAIYIRGLGSEQYGKGTVEDKIRVYWSVY